MQNLLQQCHSVVESMYLVTGQWGQQDLLSVHGQSSWDMSELPALKLVHFQRSLLIFGRDF